MMGCLKVVWHVSTLQCFILLILCPFGNRGHPQCLDYFPPFRSARPKQLCKETASYGCCTSSRERSLQKVYDFIENTGEKVGSSYKCMDFVKEIICAECHPYAAHIYDAEIPPVVQTNFSKKDERFPGLCKKYCEQHFDDCRDMMMHLPLRDSFLNFISKSSRSDFCTWAVPGDNDYCYPTVVGGNMNSQRGRKPIGDNILCVQPIAHHLSNPLAAVSPNDGTHRLFVAEQSGIVYIFDSKGKLIQNKPFLDIRKKILNSGQGWDERGFLGLVFHPKFSRNGRFFVYYSTTKESSIANKTMDESRHWFNSPKHKIRIAEYIVSATDPNLADTDSEIVLLEIEQPEANHEGGMLLFGDDGYLYIFVGDGGGAGDNHFAIGNSLNVTNLLGKVLRVDVDVYDGRRYKIPADNPMVTLKKARPEIYAYGVRNMWRCSMDRGNRLNKYGKGRIFCGDVGQNKYEEIDIIVKGGNYGWRAMEGNNCYDKSLCTSKIMRNYQSPIIVYNHTVGKSIVGGYVYRGCQNPNLQGRYFYADTVSGRIFSAKEDMKSKKWTSEEVIMGNASYCNNALRGEYAPNILSFGEDESGELYFTSVYWPEASKPYGTLYKLVDPKRRNDPELCSFNVSNPKVLKNIRKRKIDNSQNVSGKYLRNKAPCVDKRSFCRHMRAYPSLCLRFKRFATSLCRNSCKKCHAML